jgi:hypothetical protein
MFENLFSPQPPSPTHIKYHKLQSVRLEKSAERFKSKQNKNYFLQNFFSVVQVPEHIDMKPMRGTFLKNFGSKYYGNLSVTYQIPVSNPYPSPNLENIRTRYLLSVNFFPKMFLKLKNCSIQLTNQEPEQNKEKH